MFQPNKVKWAERATSSDILAKMSMPDLQWSVSERLIVQV